MEIGSTLRLSSLKMNLPRGYFKNVLGALLFLFCSCEKDGACLQGVVKRYSSELVIELCEGCGMPCEGSIEVTTANGDIIYHEDFEIASEGCARISLPNTSLPSNEVYVKVSTSGCEIQAMRVIP